jgi:hypothetical protein
MPCRAVSTFWIAHPNNNLINNAAAGSQVSNTRVFSALVFPELKKKIHFCMVHDF